MDTDTAWLAGLIDGEGSLVMLKDKRANRGIGVHVTINMTDLDTIQHAAVIMRELSGDKVNVREKRPLSGFSRRLQHVIDVCSKYGCLNILERLVPYLVTKKLQAMLIIEILKRAAGVRKYRCTALDYATMNVIKRLKHEDYGGEARAEALQILGQVTPSQSVEGTAAKAAGSTAGRETRDLTAKNNGLHERPAPYPRRIRRKKGEEIVQAPDESRGSSPNSSTPKN